MTTTRIERPDLEDDRPEAPAPLTMDDLFESDPEKATDLLIDCLDGEHFELWEILKASRHPYASAIRDRIEQRVQEMAR